MCPAGQVRCDHQQPTAGAQYPLPDRNNLVRSVVVDVLDHVNRGQGATEALANEYRRLACARRHYQSPRHEVSKGGDGVASRFQQAGSVGVRRIPHAVAARNLDSGGFAALASLTSLALIVLTPISGVQAGMARDVAASRARGNPHGVNDMTRWLFSRVLVTQIVLFAALAALTPVGSSLFGLTEPRVWLLAAAWFAVGAGVQALLGPIQGRSHFRTVGWVLADPLGILRVAFWFLWSSYSDCTVRCSRSSWPPLSAPPR